MFDRLITPGGGGWGEGWNDLLVIGKSPHTPITRVCYTEH
jgi:hypothetical protein